jgi:signal peptidase I
MNIGLPNQITGANAGQRPGFAVKSRGVLHHRPGVAQYRYMAGVRPVLCVLTLIGFLAGCGRLYTVPSSSMAPTIKPGDVIMVDPSAFSSGTPKRWDVVVFRHPLTGFTNVSRVVGLPRETISIVSGSIVVGTQRQQPPSGIANVRYVADIPGASSRPRAVVFPYVVPGGSCFVLGDNSTNAYDSRFWGALPTANILGKVTGK